MINMRNARKSADYSLIMQHNDRCHTRIRWYYEQISHMLYLLQKESKALDHMKRDMRECLRGYYSEVGNLIRQIQVADQRLHHTSRQARQVRQASQEAQSFVDQEMKVMYRRMAKLCHPDSGKGQAGRACFVRLNDAYHNKDLAEMVRLEHRYFEKSLYASETVGQKMSRLSRQYHSISDALHNVRKEKQALVRSGDYTLYRKIFSARMQGKNLVQDIKHYMQRKLEQKVALLSVA